jgi:Xaa-Pro aminopeptidase
MIPSPFTCTHLDAWLERARAEMARENLDLLILSAPESIYYLSSYQTRASVATPIWPCQLTVHRSFPRAEPTWAISC